jgi:hypothetical protein
MNYDSMKGTTMDVSKDPQDISGCQLYKGRETRESIKTKAEVIKFRDVHDVIGMDDTTVVDTFSISFSSS